MLIGFKTSNRINSAHACALLLLLKLFLLLRAFKGAGGRGIRGLWRSYTHKFRPIHPQIPTHTPTDSDPYTHRFRPYTHRFRPYTHRFRPYTHRFRPYTHRFRPYTHKFRPMNP
jgi:hypothetical protein